MRKPDDSIIQNLPSVIKNLAAGLHDPFRLDRLTCGILYITSRYSVLMDNKDFNRLMLPIFTRLVYDRFREEVPVHRFVDIIIPLLDNQETVNTLAAAIQSGIDDETVMMEKLAFKITLNFPAEV